MMSSLKVAFVDFWSGWEQDNILLDILRDHYDVALVESNPDIVIFGTFGHRHLGYRVPMIRFCPENRPIDFGECDFCFSSNTRSSERNFQMSNISWYYGFDEMLDGSYRHHFDPFLKARKENFCNFIYGNARAKERIDFCQRMVTYKAVDCLGRVLKNKEYVAEEKVDDWKLEKLDMLKNYKFTIAFENSASPGYVTEKIFQALLVGSIPIYWGAPDVKEYFNPEAFVCVDDFSSFDECVRYVEQIDKDEALYRKMREAMPILPDSRLHQMTKEKIGARLLEWIEASRAPGFRSVSFKITPMKYLAYYLPRLRRKVGLA